MPALELLNTNCANETKNKAMIILCCEIVILKLMILTHFFLFALYTFSATRINAY